MEADHKRSTEFGWCDMDVSFIAAVIFIAFCTVTTVCFASKPHVTHETSSDDISSLVEWVRATGVATVVRSHIAGAAGLPKYDLPVYERGFKAPASRFTDMIAVAKNVPDLVIIARVDESDGSATAWRTSSAGRLEATVVFNAPAAPTLIPNSRDQASTFVAVKSFLREMMAQRQRESAGKR